MKNKRSYRRRTALLTALALVLLFGSTLKDSLAYFTTYTRARGHWPVTFGDTEIDEKVENRTKEIQIENTGSTDRFVRVRAYFGEDMVGLSKEVEEVEVGSGEGAPHWSQEGDWWYYKPILKPGEKTCKLKMTFGPKSALNTDDVLDTFHVVIVQESTAVLYRKNADGTYEAYAEWPEEERTEGNEEAGS